MVGNYWWLIGWGGQEFCKQVTSIQGTRLLLFKELSLFNQNGGALQNGVALNNSGNGGKGVRRKDKI